MADPIIEWYESAGAASPLASWDYGLVDAGTVSAVKKFFVFNNKGADPDVSAATDCFYTTFDDADANEVKDLVTERWLEVRIVSDNGVPATDPDGGMKAVGGSTAANKKNLTSFDIESETYLELDTQVRIPASPQPGERSFVQRLEFKFT